MKDVFKIPTKVLVNMVFAFCHLLAYGNLPPKKSEKANKNDKYLYAYQIQVCKRIIRSLLDNDGDEITALQSRQSGKSEEAGVTLAGCAVILPILANLPMFENDERFTNYRHGLKVGVYAPIKHQAQNIFNRIRKFLTSPNALEILEDPEINVTFSTNNGENFELVFLNYGCISSIRCSSASEGSNIEGDSYHIIVVDEAQDVGSFKYSKSISPMAAFYNGTKLLTGTPSNIKGFFYNAIQRNKNDYLNGVSSRRCHFEYNYEVVCKYNERYLKYIEGEKKRLGEMSDEFQMSYNLKWILERGMFITEKAFKANAMPYDIVPYDMNSANTYVAGIDLGKTKDSTVITIGRVYWDKPKIVEISKSMDTDVEDFTLYPVYIMNWLELYGDNWDEQYHKIYSFLTNYSGLTKVAMDATGVGAGIYDRLASNLTIPVEGIVFSTSSKSDLYKNYQLNIRNGCFYYPDSDSAKETLEQQKFIKQHLELEKSYKSQNLIVSHPVGNDYHDDYPDSSALCVYAAKSKEEKIDYSDTNFFFKRENSGLMKFQSRRYTARRI